MHVFDAVGANNTDKCLALAYQRAEELGIRHAVVATTSGATGLEAARTLRGIELVVVTHSTGFGRAGVQEAEQGRLDQIRETGARVLTATHAFGGVGRAVRRKFATVQTEELVAQTLRLFGEGTKVAVEIALMAADAGLVPIDRDVVAVAGTGHGADTALVLRPAHAQDLFDLKVREIVCKPRL
jgi:hypothetical protein